jgi:hypothetical protein
MGYVIFLVAGGFFTPLLAASIVLLPRADFPSTRIFDLFK